MASCGIFNTRFELSWLIPHTYATHTVFNCTLMTISKNKILHFPFFFVQTSFLLRPTLFRRAPTFLTQSLLGFSLILKCDWIFMWIYDCEAIPLLAYYAQRWLTELFTLAPKLEYHPHEQARIPWTQKPMQTQTGGANNENHISLLSSRSVVENAKHSNSHLHICIFSMVNLLPEIYHWIAPILQACTSSVTRTPLSSSASWGAADRTRVVNLGQRARSPGCITLNGILIRIPIYEDRRRQLCTLNPIPTLGEECTGCAHRWTSELDCRPWQTLFFWYVLWCGPKCSVDRKRCMISPPEQQ